MQGCYLLDGAEFYVAIDNKGLWPNLILLPNGEIAAFIYNHPSHGYGSNSDLEMWASKDGGRLWQYRSTVTTHTEEPDAIRMNHAVGLSPNGELMALVSGYHAGQKRPFLPTQCCRSPDNGKTWQRHLLPALGEQVPYGRILALTEGKWVCALYSKTEGPQPLRSVSLYESSNHGATWQKRSHLTDNASETFLMRRKDGVWMASGRTAVQESMDRILPHGAGERLFLSQDEGRTWDQGRLVSPQGQENAHLLELQDGRILYAFTSRIPGLFGVVLRMSSDGGKTWSVTQPLITIPATDWRKTDCGYPSSVQLADGTIVTAYYFGPKCGNGPIPGAQGLPWHNRYHMGVARWRPEQ